MNPATIIDLSHPLREPVPCYPGDLEFKMKMSLASSFPLTAAQPGINPAGETDHMVVRVHALSLGTHTGTHIDAPFHFFPSGQKLHEIPLSQFVDRAVVLDVRHLARDRAKITWADVTSGITGTTETTTALSFCIGWRTDGKADIVSLWTGWTSTGAPPRTLRTPTSSETLPSRCAVLVRRSSALTCSVRRPDETPVDEDAQTEERWGGGCTRCCLVVVCSCARILGLGELCGGENETCVSSERNESMYVTLFSICSTVPSAIASFV